MRTKTIGERHFRLYIGNGNWVTLPQHVSDDLQTIYKNGLPVRYSLGPGLVLDILPNDMDCNSRTACLPGLMRIDLCYDGHPSTEAGQQALSLYVKQLLENQGTMDAFPPPAVMGCTKEHVAEKEEEICAVLTMPHVLSLPSHRHLSLVPPLPPSGPNRRRIAATLPPHRHQPLHARKMDETSTRPPHLRKRPTALSYQTKRRQLHSTITQSSSTSDAGSEIPQTTICPLQNHHPRPTSQDLTTGSIGPQDSPTMIHHLHHHSHPEDTEPSRLFSPPTYCRENSGGDNMVVDYHTSPPTAVWPYMDQGPNDMQYDNIGLPVNYFPHHHGHPLAPGEPTSVTTTPGNASSSVVTTLSYPLSNLSSPPESVIMQPSSELFSATSRHRSSSSSMNVGIGPQYELENILQSQLDMVRTGYFVNTSHL